MELQVTSYKLQTKKPGNAWVGLLLLLVFVASLGLALVSDNIKTLTQAKRAQQVIVAQALADAGIEKAVWKINQNSCYIGETGTTLSTGTIDIQVSGGCIGDKNVMVTAYTPNKTSPKVVRKVAAIISAESNADTVSFHYGVQVGPSGIVMDNNSYIDGNVYGQGTIKGSNGSAIYGDVILSGSTGKTDHATICTAKRDNNGNITGCDTSKINRLVKAHTIFDTVVYGDAYYQSLTGGATVVKGTKHPNSTDPVNQSFPIDNTMISDWETTAAAGGTVNGYTLTNGATGTLGPKKINGDLTLSNNAQLTLTGAIWVTGNVNISNGALVRLDPATFGTNGSMIIADNPSNLSTYGMISTSNNVHICGAVSVSDCQNDNTAANSKSYLMLLSTNTSQTAISAGNGGHAVIYYATTGTVNISNNSQVRAVTGGGLNLSNGASVRYDTGLISAEFSDGPGGSWIIKTWQIVN